MENLINSQEHIEAYMKNIFPDQKLYSKTVTNIDSWEKLKTHILNELDHIQTDEHISNENRHFSLEKYEYTSLKIMVTKHVFF